MHEKSLFEHYSEQKRSYYGIGCNAEDLFTDNTEVSQKRCLKFLNQHYESGRKIGLLNNDLYDKYAQHGKHLHTVSLYLLGSVLLSLFQERLSNVLKEFVPNYPFWGNDDDSNFQYIWFLPAMYHDFASCAELGTILANDSSCHRSLKFHLGNHNVLYSPYCHFPYKMGDLPSRFSPELIENYFYYRACQGKCEHGIIAGYLFFDHFVKNYFKTVPCKVPDENGNMGWDGLNWNIGHLTFAAYAADAIICHNIWLGGNAEKDNYTQFGLTPLLYNDHPENKLSVEKYPLQFMLCLLDTIEPIKRFGDSLLPKEILQGIKLIFDEKKQQLSFSWNDKIEKCREFEKWREGIVNMCDWMHVSVMTQKNTVTIVF